MIHAQVVDHVFTNDYGDTYRFNRWEVANMDFAKLLVQVLPVLKDAADTILKDEGMTEEQVIEAIISHLTPGKPNAPQLS